MAPKIMAHLRITTYGSYPPPSPPGQLKHQKKIRMTTLTARFSPGFFHSIQLQAVCDVDLLCIDAFCGFPGTLHDARVFRNSPLFEDARSGPDEPFPGNTHILGDSAYPLQKWLLTPFKNYGNLNRDHKRYNFRQSSTRMVT